MAADKYIHQAVRIFHLFHILCLKHSVFVVQSIDLETNLILKLNF